MEARRLLVLEQCEKILPRLVVDQEVKVGGITIKKIADLKDSYGTMSDISLVEVVDAKGKISKMLVKEIKFSKAMIYEKMYYSLGVKDKSQEEIAKGIAKEIIASQIELLEREEKVAKTIYSDQMILLFGEGSKMLMPFFPGITLLDPKNVAFISDQKFIDRVELIGNLVEEMEKIHELNVGHFDTKPPNILFDRTTGKVYFIDFGTSSILKSKDEMLFETKGTKDYKSPEADNGCLGLKSDDYALGLIINDILDIAMKGKDLSPFNIQLKNILHAFANRMQGKSAEGALSKAELESAGIHQEFLNSRYYKDIYQQYRPSSQEIKLFFATIKKLIAEQNKKDKNPDTIKEYFEQLKMIAIPLELPEFVQLSPSTSLSVETEALLPPDLKPEATQGASTATPGVTPTATPTTTPTATPTTTPAATPTTTPAATPTTTPTATPTTTPTATPISTPTNSPRKQLLAESKSTQPQEIKLFRSKSMSESKKKHEKKRERRFSVPEVKKK